MLTPLFEYLLYNKPINEDSKELWKLYFNDEPLVEINTPILKDIQTYHFLCEPLYHSFTNGLYDIFLLLLPYSDVDRLQIQHWCDLFITEEYIEKKKLISAILKRCNPARLDDIRMYYIDIGKITFDYSFYF